MRRRMGKSDIEKSKECWYRVSRYDLVCIDVGSSDGGDLGEEKIKKQYTGKCWKEKEKDPEAKEGWENPNNIGENQPYAHTS